MRVALISDLHASVAPLNAVFADIDTIGVDAVVCLGDIVDMGPEPRETIALLRDRGVLCIEGNHDPLVQRSGISLLDDVVDWTVAQLSEADRAWIAALPSALDIELAPGVVLHCVHGSPLSYDHQILADTPQGQLEAWCEGLDFSVLACGHTHVQMVRRWGTRTLVNAGSVGMPFEEAFLGGAPPSLQPWAEYAIVDERAVQLRRVSFDFDELARAIRAHLPDPESWLSQWSR